uniref:LEM domain-containing protein n=1 Tax=Caenorhabditis japonica TaxID=281687 RepID=A0A8R1DG65_CAEJA
MPPNVATTSSAVPRRMNPTTPTSTGKQPRAKKETLHFLAASSSTSSVDAARALLANVNAPDRDGATPLHFACVHDNVAMAQLLLTFGADPASSDKLGRTPYSVAKGNTLRFLRRYRKKDRQQRHGFFRRFFACHSRNETFFVVRGNGNGASNRQPMNPTSLADAASMSFNRGNAITKSYRNAKKKIRATFHVFKRSRSNSAATLLQDVVLTSEGLRTVTTPIRAARETPKRSMSVADLPKIPDRRAILEEDQQKNRNKTNKKTATTATMAARGRSKTPDAVLRRTPQKTLPRRNRSKSQEITDTTLKAMPVHNPMSYYNHESARNAGLRPAPSAPPLSPPEIQKTPKKSSARSKSPANTTAYFTAEESLELLGNDMQKLTIATTPINKKKKTLKTPKSGSSSEDELTVTPTTVNDGEERKVRRLRDGELRSELRKYGISPAGPLDIRNRRLYEKKLLSERRKVLRRGYSPDAELDTFKYSAQLESVLKSGLLPPDFIARARKYDDIVREEFSGNDFGYNAFCYLIMDPRILGDDVEKVTFSSFVQSIFYVGKGSKNRPLAHFIDARNERRENSEKLKNCKKLSKIDELWTLGHGIPRHEISHGVSDEEAYVREASIIEAIKLINLSNKKVSTQKFLMDLCTK